MTEELIPINARKHFFVTTVMSLALHAFVLTTLFSLPKKEPEEEKYTELKIKLGSDIVDLTQAQAAPSLQQREASLPQEQQIAQSETSQHKQEDSAVVEREEEVASAPVPTQLEKKDEVTEEKTAEAEEKNSTILAANEEQKQEVVPKESQSQAQAAVVQQLPEPPREAQRAKEEKPKVAVAPQVTPEQLGQLAPAAGEVAGSLLGNVNDDEQAQRLTSYEQMLPLWLNKFRKYPEEARMMNIEGEGDLYIKIDRQGKVLLAKIIKSTQHPILDRALMEMVEDANPVIPVPPDYFKERKAFAYRINFKFEL